MPPSPPPPPRSYLLAYNSHHLKDTFNVHSLDLKAVARSFGFSSPPRVNINIESKAAHTRKAQKGGQGADYRRMKTGGWRCGEGRGRHRAWDCWPERELQRGELMLSYDNKPLLPHHPSLFSGHKFSAQNPYGARQAGDKRQFVRV